LYIHSFVASEDITWCRLIWVTHPVGEGCLKVNVICFVALFITGRVPTEGNAPTLSIPRSRGTNTTRDSVVTRQTPSQHGL